jgi:hypothetical protein
MGFGIAGCGVGREGGGNVRRERYLLIHRSGLVSIYQHNSKVENIGCVSNQKVDDMGEER